MTIGRGCLPNLVGGGTVEKIYVQTEYLDYSTRNIQARRLSHAASVVVFYPLDALSILCRRIRCRCCSIRSHLLPPKPPLSSYIPQAHRLDPAASIFVSDPSDALHIPRPLPTPLLSLLSPRDRLTLTTLQLSLSIP